MPMKADILEKVQQETADWEYLEELPAEWFGLSLQKQYREVDDTYELFSYENRSTHRGLCAYYHQETKEYKLRVRIGLTEFCQMQYITSSFSAFEEHLRLYLEHSIGELAQYSPEGMSYVTRELNIPSWDYHSLLPDELEGFQLFIRPNEPVRVLNGSYIVLDYTDFDIKSNFIIYYNEFRCEFFGEARIKDIPEMNYTFDSPDIPALEEKLRLHLTERLREIRTRAEA